MADTAKYVAIIMDGNARWARERGLDILEGHRAGAKALKSTVRDATELGIEELTAFSFSTENWQRPQSEVDGLMSLFGEMIESEAPELKEEGVKLCFVGERSGVSEDLLNRMEWGKELTAEGDRMTLYVAFNYGSRSEIEHAAKGYAKAISSVPENNEQPIKLREFFYAPEMADPDLLIRTSGEQRISNFMLWQCAYAELVFTDVRWPDFERGDLVSALDQYTTRKRRFGARASDL